MKIVATSDWHADAVSAGVPRLAEVRAGVLAAARAAADLHADLFVFAGDLADPDTGGEVLDAVSLVVQVARKVAAAGVPAVYVAGNHDVREDGSGRTTLQPLGAAFAGDPLVTVAELPVILFARVDVPFTADVLCLPFTPTSHGYDPEEWASRVSTDDCGVPLLVVSHLSVRGVVPGEEASEMPRGRDVWLPDEALARVAERRPVLVLQGHYHRRQRHTCPSGLTVEVVGAAARFSHGQADCLPGYLVVDFG